MSASYLRSFWASMTVACCALSPAAIADVLVVTDSHHSVQPIANAKIIELDLPARIQAELAADLPTDPVAAATRVKQRLREGGPALQRKMVAAYQNVADAWGLGVTKIPAVIVDRRYVIYGDANVARAVAHIETYRRERL